MRHLSIWLLLAAILVFLGCSKDSEVGVPAPGNDPEPAVFTHRISVESALSELQSVLVSIEGETRNGAIRSVANISAVRGADVIPATRSTEASDVEELVYIANFENGEGYAILAADDRLESVIAITEQGSLTPEQFASVANGEYNLESGDLPPVSPDVVAYATGLGGGFNGGGTIGGGGGPIGGGGGGTTIPPFTDLTGGGDVPPHMQYTRYKAWETVSKIGPFLQMKWNQGAPYNYYVQQSEGKPYVGCVAVATGQIIATNYYNYFRTQLNRLPYIIKDRRISWPTIFTPIDDYINNSNRNRYFEYYDRSVEALAVAQFLYAVGLSVNTTYRDDASSAPENQAAAFLRLLGFKDVWLSHYSEGYVNMMIRERRLPIFVSGFDKTALEPNTDQVKKKGHAWVIDGILYQTCIVETVLKGSNVVLDSRTEGRTLFHCNFGWGGRCDGYYYSNIFYDLAKKAREVEKSMDEKVDSLNQCYASDKWVITYRMQ